MDAVFKFFYPIIEETQTDFEGRDHIHEVFCEGHITYKGRLICNESREVIMNRAKTKKSKEMDKRAVTPKLCPVCFEGWKNNPESSYYRYVNGVPPKVTSIEKNLIGAQA